MLRIWEAIQSLVPRPTRNEHAVAPDALPGIPVVALISDDHDRNILKNITRTGLNVYFTQTYGEAWTTTNRLKSPVVLCDCHIPGLDWHDTVRILASAKTRPCVILLSRVVDEYLLRELIASGGYNVVVRPLRDEDAIRSIKLALLYWRSTSRLPALR